MPVLQQAKRSASIRSHQTARRPTTASLEAVYGPRYLKHLVVLPEWSIFDASKVAPSQTFRPTQALLLSGTSDVLRHQPFAEYIGVPEAAIYLKPT